MLSREENQLLTQVGPGTPMGALLRYYWQPVLLSSELPEPDHPPLRVRVLGEDLVAFRDTEGRVGLLGANCPHRGSPLYFGRNEDGGLRCIYHGWKFDVAGRCIDMPNVPRESDYKLKVSSVAYRCEERAGIIWTYMGPLADPPALPNFEWAVLTPEHKLITKQYLECNFVQGMEGDFDGSHVSFLHAPLVPEIHQPERVQRGAGRAGDGDQSRPLRYGEERYSLKDPHPVIMVLHTDCGMMTAARRDAEPDTYYWRFNNFVMPFYAGVPWPETRPAQINIWAPIDDEHTMIWRVTYRPDRPFTAEERMADLGGHVHIAPDGYLRGRPDRPGSQWMPKLNRSTEYGLDRDSQRTRSFSGLPWVWAQDRTCTEGMGPIMDRTTEHLGASDVAVIQLRRLLLSAARAVHEHGAPAPGVGSEPWRVAVPTQILPRTAQWDEVAQAALDRASGKLPLPVAR